MGKKGAMPTYATVDDYINSQSENAQLMLRELRILIKEVVPEAVEIPNYKVPSFTLVTDAKPKSQLMIVAYAKYVSFYPHQAAVDHFSEELTDFKLGKGTVSFVYGQALPKDLIKRMVAFRKNELLG